MTPFQYAKQETIAGRFAQMLIISGNHGTFFLETSEFVTLDGVYMSREKAENARSKAIAKAAKFIK